MVAVNRFIFSNQEIDPTEAAREVVKASLKRYFPPYLIPKILDNQNENISGGVLVV